MRVLNVEQLDVLIESIEEMPPEKLQEIVIYFPYEDMVNIKSYDDQLLRKYAEFLTKLVNTPYFIEKYSNVSNTLYFLWKKLCEVEDIDAEGVITDLLNLYCTILRRVNGDIRVLELIVGSKETLEAIFFVLQSPLLNKTHCTILTNIVHILISADKKLMHDSVMIIEVMLNKFHAISNSHDLAVICTLVVREYYTIGELFHVCGNWLLSEGPKVLLSEAMNEKIANDILEGIAIIILSTNLDYPDNFWPRMQSLLPQLFRFIISKQLQDSLRDICMLVISIIVSNYLQAELCEVIELLKGLPWDVYSWPNHSNLKIFFIICELLHQQCEHFIWSTESIFNAISKFVHSSYIFSVETVVLKSLCYLYPLVKPANPSQNYVLLGDSLLILVEKTFHNCIENICSLREDQLSWIFSRGSMRLKKTVICYWLKCDKVDDLARVLTNNPSVKLLKELILDPYLDEEVSIRLDALINKSQSTKFLQNLILYIPVNYNNGVILSRLLRIGCQIPNDPALMFKLCQFLLRLLLIVDEANIKFSLSYIAEMINSLRKHDNFIEFYHLTGIWKFLACVNANAKGGSTEIIRIFKIMTLIQKSKKLTLNESVEIDLVSSLRGNSDKVELPLQLLYHILDSDGTFLKLPDATLTTVFLTLFDLYAESGKKSKVLDCLRMIMKMRPTLSWSKVTMLFIEYHASEEVDEVVCPAMLRFLRHWLNRIKRIQNKTLRQRVNVPILKNFLERISCVTFITEKQNMKLLVEDAINSLAKF